MTGSGALGFISVVGGMHQEPARSWGAGGIEDSDAGVVILRGSWCFAWRCCCLHQSLEVHPEAKAVFEVFERAYLLVWPPRYGPEELAGMPTTEP